MRNIKNILTVAVFAAVIGFTAVTVQAQNCTDTDYNCIVTKITKEIAADPTDLEAYFFRGQAFTNLAKYDAAISDFTKYIASKPANKRDLADGYNERGIAYKRKGDIKLAIADYESAIANDSGEGYFYNNLGMAQELDGRVDVAIVNYKLAVIMSPNYGQAYIGLGNALFTKKDSFGAIAAFTKAIEINANEAEAYYNRSRVLGQGRQFLKAIADLDKYISLNVTNPTHRADGFMLRGANYSLLANYTQAIKDLTTAIEINPNQPLSYTIRAHCYRELNKIPLAIADEAKAASLKK